MKTIAMKYRLLALIVVVTVSSSIGLSLARMSAVNETATPAPAVSPPGGDGEVRSPKPETLPATGREVGQMISNPRWWVDYLKENVLSDQEDTPTGIRLGFPEIESMEADPQYWLHYLESTISEQESADQAE